MVTIGILGGIASGKTFIAKQLETLGAYRIDADRLAHQVLDEPEVQSVLMARWGDRVLNASGSIDRSAVAEIVFPKTESASGETVTEDKSSLGGTSELAFLEAVTHPRIAEGISDQIRARAAEETITAVVLDAAVLLKAGWNHLCDTILFVEVPSWQRLQRAVARGWSKEEFAVREAAQESLDTKRRVADWVIDNGGTPDRTFAQVQQFWQTLPASPPRSGTH